MKTVKVWFANGNSLVTDINGTKETILAYYLNQVFNLGDDKLVKCVAVMFLSGV